MKISVVIALGFLFIGLSSCEKDNISGDVFNDPELIDKLYAESVDTLFFQSNRYILEADLSRNFFPGGPIPKKHIPLIASIFLVCTDSISVSEDLTMVKLYVINDRQVWAADVKNYDQADIPPYKMEMINNNGPEWPTDIFVDVVVQIQNTVTTEKYYLAAYDQRIPNFLRLFNIQLILTDFVQYDPLKLSVDPGFSQYH